MTIENLIETAKSEDWDTVDSEIPRICNDKNYIIWAYGPGLINSDGNVRDLAVSILEKSTSIPEEEMPEVKDKLYSLMLSDDNVYVRFRSAFALAAHGPGDQKEDVLRVLHKALEDPDVAEIAKGYIAKLQS